MLSLEKRWKLCLSKQGSTWDLIMDLSKAFDKLNHELPIAKLHAYGFLGNSGAKNQTKTKPRYESRKMVLNYKLGSKLD